MDYIYKLDDILERDVSKIKSPNGCKVFVCLYKILFKINSTKEGGFLQYLLYKYKKTDECGEIMSFPFLIKTTDMLKKSNELCTHLSNNPTKYKGFLEFEGNVYIFYNDVGSISTICKLQSTDKYWWCLIDEICNNQTVIHYPVNDSVCKLFYNFPNLIYLYKGNRLLETPTVVFKGSHLDITSYLAAFGQRVSSRSRFGPYYTLGTYNWSIRWAGWSRGYKKHIFNNKNISDNNGKYKKGGVIRMAIFLGHLEHIEVIFNNKSSYFNDLISWYDDETGKKTKKEKDVYYGNAWKNTGKWALQFNAIIVPKVKYKNIDSYFNINTEFIVTNNNDKKTLSIHELDMSTIKENWDPLCKNYKIL